MKAEADNALDIDYIRYWVQKVAEGQERVIGEEEIQKLKAKELKEESSTTNAHSVEEEKAKNRK